jgi:hypothetical protein
VRQQQHADTAVVFVSVPACGITEHLLIGPAVFCTLLLLLRAQDDPGPVLKRRRAHP